MTSPSKVLILVLFGLAAAGLGIWSLAEGEHPSGLVLEFDTAASADSAAAGPGESLDASERGFVEDDGGQGDGERIVVEGSDQAPEAQPSAPKGVEIVGRVTNASGGGIGGAELRFWFVTSRRFGRQRFRVTPLELRVKSDGDGSYRAKIEVPFRRVSMVAGAKSKGFAPKTASKPWNGEETLSFDPLVLDPGARVRGRVVESSVKPLAAAQVRPRFAERRWGLIEQMMEPVTTDELGRFEVADVAAHELRLWADAKGFVPESSDKVAPKAGGIVDIGVLKMTRGATVSGVVKDQLGRPIQGASVSGRLSRKRAREEMIEAFAALRSQRGPSGNSRSPRGSTPRGMRPRGARGNRNRSNRPRGPNARSRGPGARPRGARSARGPSGSRGSNQARNAQRTREDRELAQKRREILDRFRRNSWLRREVKTDEDGRFRLEGLPKGTLQLSARHEDFVTETVDPLEGVGAKHIELRLQPRLTATGVVVDARSGAPLKQFGIQARRIGPLPGASTRGRGLQRSGRDGGRGPAAAAAAQRQAQQLAAARRAREAQQRAEAAARAKQAAYQKQLQAKLAKMSPKRREATLERERARQAARQKRDAERARAQQARAARIAARDKRVASEAQRRNAQREAERRERDAWMERRLGPSKRLPGRVPKPSAHAEGRFVLRGLEPGVYLFDIAAEQYPGLAAGPFTISESSVKTPLTIRLQRGAKILGRVLDDTSERGVSNAEVRLEILPPIPKGRPAAATPLTKAMRPPRNGIRMARVQSGKDGAFEIPAQRPGVYRLTVQRKGYSPQILEEYRVPAGRDIARVAVELSKGARLEGKVRGLPKNERGTVVVASPAGLRRQLNVSGPNAKYSFADLPPGEYFVRLNRHSRPGGMFRQALDALLRPGGDRTDVVLRSGKTHRHDLRVDVDRIGSLEGRVLLNGRRAPGLRLRLEALDAQSLPVDPEARATAMRILRNVMARATRGDGRYDFPLVPAGRYRVVVTRSTSSRSPTLLAREIFVPAGAPQHLDLDVRVGRVHFELVDENGKPRGRGILLVAAKDAVDLDYKKWRKKASYRSVRLKNGRGTLGDVRPGQYVWLAYGNGVKKNGRLLISAGERRERIVAERPKPKRRSRRNKRTSGKTTQKKG